MTRLGLASALFVAVAAVTSSGARAQQEPPAVIVARALDLVRTAKESQDAVRRAETISSAVRALESTPPERRVQTGTSATSCRSTES